MWATGSAKLNFDALETPGNTYPPPTGHHDH